MQSYLEQFQSLMADTIASQRVLGLASPMLGEIQDNPQPIELGIRSLIRGLFQRGDKPRFPRVQAAVDWLLGRGVATEETLERIPDEAARLARATDSPFRGDAIRREIEESVRLNEDRRTFQKRIRANLKIRKGEEGTLLRTQAKRSYLAGQKATMLRPENRLRWPYVMYVATPDERVRPHHWALDSRASGSVAQVGSPQHEQMIETASEWNCRCSMIPVTLGQVRKLGLDTS